MVAEVAGMYPQPYSTKGNSMPTIKKSKKTVTKGKKSSKGKAK